MLNLKTRTAMNAKMLVLAICVEAIMFLLSCNLHECTFNVNIKIVKVAIQIFV